MNRNVVRRLGALEKASARTTPQQREAWDHFVQLLDHAATAKRRGDESAVIELNQLFSEGWPQ